MAKVTNAFTSYAAQGNRAKIYRTSPSTTSTRSTRRSCRRFEGATSKTASSTGRLKTCRPQPPPTQRPATTPSSKASSSVTRWRNRPSGKTTSRRFPSATPPCQEPRKSPTPQARVRKWRTRWRSPPRRSSPIWRRPCAPGNRASPATTPPRPLASPKASPTGSGGPRHPGLARRPAPAALWPASSPAPARPQHRRLHAVVIAGGSQIQISEAMLGQAMQNAYTNGVPGSLLDRPAGAEADDIHVRGT